MNDAVENSVDYVNNNPIKEPFPIHWREVAAPFVAIALSFLFWHIFSFENMVDALPGLGIPVFVISYFAGVFLMLGRKASLSPAALLLTGAALMLALCCWFYGFGGFIVLNCFIILFTAAAATFLLSGQSRHDLRSARLIPETVSLSCRALFTRMDRPFRLLGRLGGRHRKQVGRVALALLLSLPLLAVVLSLLVSADAVFESLFDRLGSWLGKLSPGRAFWKTLRALLLALFIASGLYFIAEPPVLREPDAPQKRPASLYFLLPTLLLDMVYVLFCAIQIKYLFGGAEAAAMAGSWAEYAREGFFQLVAVAAINLSLCLLAAHKDTLSGKTGLVLRIACGLLLVLTAIILASAFRRMQLYIQAYGLSVLRLLTLWGMAVIAAGIFAAGIKLLRSRFSFFRVFAPFVLAAWCLFSLMNPCAVIARYNVDRYLEGSLEQIDTEYLSTLGTDTLPALRHLEEASGMGADAIDSLLRDMDEPRDWAQHNLSYRHLREG